MKVSSSVALAASSALALGSIAPAFAHEPRILPGTGGQIRLVVGHHVEPAFEDSYNAVDVILSTFDGTCTSTTGTTVNIGLPIDTGGTSTAIDPDAVNLKVAALYLKKAVPPTGPNGSIAPVGIIAKMALTDAFPLGELFSSPGTYDSSYRPTHPGDGTTGAYGFHIKGTVHAGSKVFTSCTGDPIPLPARTAKIDTYFVCSVAGSLVPPDAFGCVTAIQPFPGQVGDEYVANSPFRR